MKLITEDYQDLKACPFCGKKDPIEIAESNYPGSYSIVCNRNEHGCGASAGWNDGIKKALAAWNHRERTLGNDEIIYPRNK